MGKVNAMKQHSQLRRFGLFDTNVPRYTSYPPATQFAGDVSPARYADWLSQIPAGARVSIYLHVPFCRRLCWFCACRTQGTKTGAPVPSYVDTLIAEVEILRRALPQGVIAQRVHWGGGTPTLLPPADIARLARAVAVAFPQSGTSEISVEIDPNEIDDARLDALADMGMTRASIGVQDFDPEIQRIIGREQSFAITHAAVEGLRARGITSLNTDILYGLPKQSRARIATSIQMLLSLNPDRIALYGYAHVPWMAKRQSLIPTEDLPAPEARLALFETASADLTSDGYTPIGIDHFARPTDSLALAAQSKHLRRNFQGYTDDTCDVLLGLGASAISRLPQGYAQNAPGTAAYQKAVRSGALATSRGHTFARDDTVRARMIEMLMCDFRIDTNTLLVDTHPARSHIAGALSEASAINALLDETARTFDGHAIRTDTGLAIPPHARPLTRLIARHLDAYVSQPAGHSSAI